VHAIPKKEMHSKDIYNRFTVAHYSSLFQYFFQSNMVPTLVEKIPKFLVYLLTFFGNTITMIMIEVQFKGRIQRIPWNLFFWQTLNITW